MSLPRLSFLYPPLRRYLSTAPQRCGSTRHGSAVEPIQLNPDPPPTPPAPRSDSDTESKSKLVDGTPVEAPAPQPTADARAVPAAPSPAPAAAMPFGAAECREHHFDTYSSVKQLAAGGLSEGQSVAVMKGIRGLLDKNMAAARANLVSKSKIENETYLFKAACSELRGEVQLAKKASIDELKTERTRIQTELDLLNHAFLAEIMGLKDELNGMFNDRKMVTRAEQRAMDNKVCAGRTVLRARMLTQRRFRN